MRGEVWAIVRVAWLRRRRDRRDRYESWAWVAHTRARQAVPLNVLRYAGGYFFTISTSRVMVTVSPIISSPLGRVLLM
jgi:hypothetical protein